jgi:hypothetical protein
LLITFAAMPSTNWGEIVFFHFCRCKLLYRLFIIPYFLVRVAFYKRKEKRSISATMLFPLLFVQEMKMKNLARNLPGVLVQNYSSTSEVVVINDNSVDDSKYIFTGIKKYI